jgi:hypothetical protein
MYSYSFNVDILFLGSAIFMEMEKLLLQFRRLHPLEVGVHMKYGELS